MCDAPFYVVVVVVSVDDNNLVNVDVVDFATTTALGGCFAANPRF